MKKSSRHKSNIEKFKNISYEHGIADLVCHYYNNCYLFIYLFIYFYSCWWLDKFHHRILLLLNFRTIYQDSLSIEMLELTAQGDIILKTSLSGICIKPHIFWILILLYWWCVDISRFPKKDFWKDVSGEYYTCTLFSFFCFVLFLKTLINHNMIWILDHYLLLIF